MKIFSLLNIDSVPRLQSVELASFFQIPTFHIVGLPAEEVSEARERIRAAFETSGFEFPRRRVIVNLSPSSVRKHGTGLDLPMALRILDHDQLAPSAIRALAWGELGLDGKVKPTGQAARCLFAAWKEGCTLLILNNEDAASAWESVALLTDSSIFSGPPPLIMGVDSLKETWQKLRGEKPYTISRVPLGSAKSAETTPLLAVSPSLRRILFCSVAGEHHLLLLGSKGTGKSQALSWLRALQPPIEPEIKFSQLLIAELQQTHGCSLATKTGTRKVGSQVRPPALLGSVSGGHFNPGEFALAHGGTPIADELPEWSRDSREALREPLETAACTLTRLGKSIQYPARFRLAATGNFCPCGGWPKAFPYPAEDPGILPPRCRCAKKIAQAYLAKLSGPILDRIDLLVTVGPGLSENASVSEQEAVRAKDEVTRVNDALKKLWGCLPGNLDGEQTEEIIERTPGLRSGLRGVVFSSLRARHKTARIALTLAALDSKDCPSAAHVFEASHYRPERFEAFS